MRCVTDFWGNCTGVASNRHDYRWRYVRPGSRPAELRESATARKNTAKENSIAQREKGQPRQPAPRPETVAKTEKASPRGKASPLENANVPTSANVPASASIPARETATIPTPVGPRENIPLRETATGRERPAAREKANASRDSTTTRESTTICHDRRRVVGDERPSQDDARRAAENGWMGAVRYDYGERYQDINRARDVRLSCGPSSVSAALKTPHYRCAVEATPCRGTVGTPTEPDDRRYDPPVELEDRISRK